MVLESKNGMMLMEILEYMKENGLRTLFLVTVNKPGAITQNIQVLFWMIRCMEMEHSPGLMGEAMLENLKMIKGQVLEYTLTKMVTDMKETGKTTSKMEMES